MPVAAVELLLSEDDIIDRIAKSKTIEDWFVGTQLVLEGDGGYDIVESLCENRIWSGEASQELQ